MYGVARATNPKPFAVGAAFLSLPDLWLGIFLDECIDVTDNMPPLCLLYTSSFYRKNNRGVRRD